MLTQVIAVIIFIGAVSRRLTEDCVLRSKTYEVNTDCKTVFASHILASPKYNPPPQFANWGTSFQKEAFRCGGTEKQTGAGEIARPIGELKPQSAP